MKVSSFRSTVVTLILLCGGSFCALGDEVEGAIKKLQMGEAPGTHDQEFWRKTYKAWLESEEVGKLPGDPEIGKALSSLCNGSLPDEHGTAAIVRLYNRSRSKARIAEAGKGANGAPPVSAAPSPPPPQANGTRLYVGVFVGFLIAVVGLGVIAKVIRR